VQIGLNDLKTVISMIKKRSTDVEENESRKVRKKSWKVLRL